MPQNNENPDEDAAKAVKFASREEAIDMLIFVSDRWRNYELEDRIALGWEDKWVISEFCPFNGIYCRWREYAPREDFVEYRELLTSILGENDPRAGWLRDVDREIARFDSDAQE